MLAAPSLGGPWVSTEKHASPSPNCCWAASSLRVVLARPTPAMLATPAMLERRPACSVGMYVAEPSPSPPAAAGNVTVRWMSAAATASTGGVCGSGGGGGGGGSWGRETAASMRLRAYLLGEPISSLGPANVASRRPSGPSTMHARGAAAYTLTQRRRYTEVLGIRRQLTDTDPFPKTHQGKSLDSVNRRESGKRGCTGGSIGNNRQRGAPCYRGEASWRI